MVFEGGCNVLVNCIMLMVSDIVVFIVMGEELRKCKIVRFINVVNRLLLMMLWGWVKGLLGILKIKILVVLKGVIKSGEFVFIVK